LPEALKINECKDESVIVEEDITEDRQIVRGSVSRDSRSRIIKKENEEEIEKEDDGV
jgi:hypothetical protein